MCRCSDHPKTKRAVLAARLTAETGAEAMAATVDIRNADSIRRLREAILWRFDRIDVLVNNAALNEMVEDPARGKPIPFESLPLETWQSSIDVNVTGTFLCCQVFGEEMARRGSGSIINIASTYGIVAPDQSLYRNAEGHQTMYRVGRLRDLEGGRDRAYPLSLRLLGGPGGARQRTVSGWRRERSRLAFLDRCHNERRSEEWPGPATTAARSYSWRARLLAP